MAAAELFQNGRHAEASPALFSTPYTLHHPTPHTLHPTPYTLHLAPYTLHLTPSTLHPPPSTLLPTPYIGTYEPVTSIFWPWLQLFSARKSLSCSILQGGGGGAVPRRAPLSSRGRAVPESCRSPGRTRASFDPTPSSSSLLLSSLELSDTQVYEPQIRALLGTHTLAPKL